MITVYRWSGVKTGKDHADESIANKDTSTLIGFNEKKTISSQMSIFPLYQK